MVRNYESELRQRAKAQTRTSIVEGLVRLLLEEGVHAFTMQNVAKRAGVSLRTVYRHFASREALLEALSDLTEALMAELLDEPAPTSLADLPSLTQMLFATFGETGDPLRAAVLASIAMGHRTASYEERQDLLLRIVRRTFPNLSPREQREAGTVLRLLSGTRGWFIMTAEAGLADAEAGAAARWAVDALLRDLKARNDAASPTP